MHTNTRITGPARRPLAHLSCGLALLILLAAPRSLSAQGARLQLVLPPSTWRFTLSGEIMPLTPVQPDALRPALHPTDVGVRRATARLSAPVWKRGLYTTIVTNDIVYDRFALSYGPETPSGVIQTPVVLPSGPDALQSVQHELGVSHAINPRWRLTGALQHGFFTSAGSPFDPGSYRAAGGAFVSRVYRPTLQVGAGVVALNIAPYVIPTVRILHVGQKWRTDVLLPRAETFRDVGRGIEIGGVLRFLGNRWDGSGEIVASNRSRPAVGATEGSNRFRRTTYQQVTGGPALTLRVAHSGLVQLEAGVALRRMLVEGTSLPSGALNTLPLARRFDTALGEHLRLSGRLTF